MKGLFLLGALSYPALELLYRGRTHYSMGIAGGTAALMINGIRKLPASYPLKTLLCGAGITGIEYLCGCIWNKDYQVWDYRGAPLNVQGQICLPYTLLWCTLSAAVMAALNQKDKHNKPDS